VAAKRPNSVIPARPATGTARHSAEPHSHSGGRAATNEGGGSINGSAPIAPLRLRFLDTDTRTPYVAQYNGEDTGKGAHYMLGWVNTKGEQGPWSQTVSATITG
jgi:hypothetical protein